MTRKTHSEAVEAGLGVCDMRLLYKEQRSSTPVKRKICSNSNMGCWSNGYNDASNIVAPSSYITVTAPIDPDREANLEETLDESYGGAWARPSGGMINCPDSPPRGIHSFGISIFDSTSSQVFPFSKNDCESNKLRHQAKDKTLRTQGSDLNNTQSHSNSHINESTNKTEIPILDRRVHHMKSRAELKAEQLSNDKLCDFRNVRLRILVNNVRGFYSKRESFQAILAREDIDIACICETFMTGTKFPELPGYISFFRNRKERAAGGISVMIRENKAQYAVKLESGLDDNEFMAIKLTNCSPHLVIILYYGCQAKMGVDTIKLHLSQLMQTVTKYTDMGCTVQMVGDFNLHLGNTVIKANHEEASAVGKLFLEMLEINSLVIMNNLSPNPITFIDRSGKDHKREVLDLVITNQPGTVSGFKTDDEKYEFTPYSVQMRKGKSSRTYADHMSIIYEVETKWQDRVEFQKNTIWNYKRQIGDLKYNLFTANSCNFLMDKIDSEPDINQVHKAFVKVMTKGKFQSYGKRTVTESKVRKINDDLVWRERISDLHKLQLRFSEEKEVNQIYKIRKVILKGQSDKQNLAIEVEETGEILEDLDEVLDHVLAYNEKNMDKVEPSAEVADMMRRKAEHINKMLDDKMVEDFPDEIPWHIFMQVLTKVLEQKKAVFRDIIKSGRNFKYALFCLLNRMYKREEFPEISIVTWLTKIWKRKGPAARLKNNRFIHGKEPISKMFEKCVVAIIAEKLDEATPVLQAGSRKGRSTRDQMLKVILMQKYHENKGKPLPILLVDVKSCFDKMILDDVVFDTIEAGADLKATRVIRKFSNKTEIRLRGDPRNGGQGESRVIYGTLGQGSNFAPPGIGLTTSKSLWAQFQDEEADKILAKVGDVRSDPQSYVDDMATMPNNAKSLRAVGHKVGRALELISLQSHPDKTEVVVSGKTKKAEVMRDTLTTDPAKMQGNPIKIVKSGMYLGMKISQDGHKDTIDATVKHRVAKAWGRVAEVKSSINDARMTTVGWLRAGVNLIRSVIIPSLTYSADVWANMNKCTEKYLRDEYKGMIYIILDIPTNTKWTSIMADLCLPNIMCVVDKLRINYMNHTLWGKGDPKLKEMLEEEHKVNPKASLVAAIDEVCSKYSLPHVSAGPLLKSYVKRRVKLKDEIDIWVGNVMSPVTQNVGLERIRLSTNFYKLNKRQSQALLAFNAGAFKLKTAWGDFHEIQRCLAPLCGHDDELDHIKQCPFYETKWDETFNEDSKQLATYLVSLDRERRRRWKGECLF